MKIFTATTGVVLPLLLFAIEPTNTLLIKSIWQRLTRNNPNNQYAANARPEIARQNNIVRLPEVVHPENIDYLQQVVRPENIDRLQEVAHPDNIARLNSLDLPDESESRSFLVDGTKFDIVYWNSELGNSQPLAVEFNNEKNITNYWLRGRPLKVITHGWLGSDEEDKGVFSIKTAYVAVGNVNVITVDWNNVASNYMYPLPAYLTAEVGSIVAKILENLVNLAVIDPSDIHIIGHSLGAHVSGACGAAFSLGKIGRITGLDPAGPGFEMVALQSDTLDKTDAQFVDVIHTAAGTAGYKAAIGHADFYPNNGAPPQPGCFESYLPSSFVNVIGCSHSRAHILYTESIYNKNSFVSVKCPSWTQYTNGQCKNNEKTSMGHDANPNSRGIFYLTTNSSSPYSIPNNH